MKSILITLILIFTSFQLYSAQILGKVVKVHDGDTITVQEEVGESEIFDRSKFTVRLFFIDAPEKKQEFGEEAAKYLTDLLLNKTVVVKFREIDNYGRIVGVVFFCDYTNITDQESINIKILKNGYGWLFEEALIKDFAEDLNGLKLLQESVRKKKLGLWKGNPIAPWEFRKQNKIGRKEKK